MIEYKIAKGFNTYQSNRNYEYNYITYNHKGHIINHKYYDNGDILISRYNKGNTFSIRYLKTIR